MAHKAMQQSSLSQQHSIRGHAPQPVAVSCPSSKHHHHRCHCTGHKCCTTAAPAARHAHTHSQATPVDEASSTVQGVHGSSPAEPSLEPVRGATLATLALASLLQGGCALAAEPGAVQQLQLGPKDPGFEIWVGLAAGVIPFLIGSWEFGKRIVIQQRCELCGGRGLVPSTNPSASYLRKCPQCGGFFPWISWKMFLTSTASPGNGGPLQQPRGQKSVFYEVPAAAPTKEQVQAARAAYMAQGKQAGDGDAPAGSEALPPESRKE